MSAQPHLDRWSLLHAVAEPQAGAFTRQQALRAGFTSAEVRWLLRHGWHDVRRGVYTDAQRYGELDEAGQHLVRGSAQILAMVGAPAISHESAGVVLGLPVLTVPTRPLLTRAPRFDGESSASSWLKLAALDVDDLVEVSGVDVTAPGRLVADVARANGFLAGVVTADAALRAGLSRAELRAAVQRTRLWPGGRAALAVERFADPRAESALESVGRVRMHEIGMPAGTPQLLVVRWGRVVARVDHGWEDLRVIGEADGLVKYTDPEVLREEKRRELVLEDCGLGIFRYGWDDAMHHPQRIRERYERAVLRAPDRLAEGVVLRHSVVRTA